MQKLLSSLSESLVGFRPLKRLVLFPKGRHTISVLRPFALKIQKATGRETAI